MSLSAITTSTSAIAKSHRTESLILALQSVNLSDRASTHELSEDARNHLESLHAFVKRRNLHWRYGRESEFLHDLAEKASALVTRAVASSGNRRLGREIANDLVKLALYDIVIFCDNSSSMSFMDRGARQVELEETLKTIVSMTSIFATGSVKVQFVNGKKGGVIKDPKDVEKLLKGVRFRGETPIGTELKEKVLEGFLRDVKEGELRKPLLVTIITDGQPEGESRDMLKKVIREAKMRLDKTKYGESALAVQISHVGGDPEAVKFIEDLDNDPEVGDIIDCVSSYEKERLEVRRNTGEKLTEGDWVVKLLIGAIDQRYDELDEEEKEEDEEDEEEVVEVVRTTVTETIRSPVREYYGHEHGANCETCGSPAE